MSMTVREHLQLYTALKGVPEPRSLAVETALQALNLSGIKNSFTYMELLYSNLQTHSPTCTFSHPMRYLEVKAKGKLPDLNLSF